MNITSYKNITNIANQLTTGALQQGFRHNPGAVVHSGKNVTPGTDIRNVGTLKSFEEAARQGYRENYSIQDAAESLWRQETQTFNLKDLEDPEKSKEFLEYWRMQARWDMGIQGGPTKEEVMSAYIQNLRQNGLSSDVNWSGLSRELESFKTTSPEELEDGLNYLASRYVAVLDKLERNYQGEELTARRTKLDEVYQAGKAGMIDGYTKLLQDNLGISSRDAQAVKDSLAAILSEKVDTYRGVLEKVQRDVSQTGLDSVWLKNHDAYIASQLRAAGTAGQSGVKYSVQDLSAAGQIAQSYQTELFNASSGGRNEATLALNLSMADMKVETLIQKGLVSQNMATLLRNSRAQGHENVLAALDRSLASRENSRAPGEPEGTYAPVDRTVFRGIYNAVINTYRKNGGDGAGAIRAGVSAGEKLTAQATAENPDVARWGVSMKYYFQEFYNTPGEHKDNLWNAQFNNLLIPERLRQSTWQKYVTNWQNFLTSIGGGVDVQA